MIIGRFYFRLTSSGIAGEYSHDASVRPLPEVGTRNDGVAAIDGPFGFVGDYHTTWRASSGESVYAALRITEKEGCEGIFSLEWTAMDRKSRLYRGEGMLCGEVLVGDYRD
ncbi:hypothetical protein JIN84_05625 [Luteolibacter yonseiensis]|uniref:Uncharacterized protein n=1 Tax=Luteolibacter yonseiensis TaxID=1144680 RepID=A0A934R4F4_9BACT|nr:hypothetical protein [Luteolibacter yonseiensis]MBK1815080.1 hypothetical protein [Luteolibacter yonseiensis]